MEVLGSITANQRPGAVVLRARPRAAARKARREPFSGRGNALESSCQPAKETALSVADNSVNVPDLRDARLSVPPSVVYRNFAKETVVLNLDTGLYHGVNPTGGHMLATVEACGTIREAAQKLSAEYEVPAAQLESDLCEFCDALIQRGLLQVDGA
jgi:hypothetical protein